MLPPNAGVTVIIDNPEAGMIVTLFPTVMEAIIGLYLIQRGLRKESAITFAAGVLVGTIPLWRYMLGLIAQSGTDYNLFVYNLKQYLIDHNIADYDTAMKLDTNALILATVLIIYTGALLGTRYAPLVKELIMEGKRLKFLPKVRGKIKEYKAKRMHKGWVPISPGKARALLKSLRSAEKAAKLRQLK